MHLTDSHAHLDMYGNGLAGVLARALAVGVGTILAIGIGEGPGEMQCALEIAQEFKGQPATPAIYASAGIHPQEAHRADADSLAKLARLAADERVIAIGEIGLDYYHADNPAAEVQRTAFVAQMQVAAAARRPVLIHCRTSELATPEAKKKFGAADAWEELLELLVEHWTASGLGGIMHCFSGTVEQARRALDFGFYLSFAGNLTYPRAAGLREVAAYAPADRILVETDAPFLAPIPHRGQRNEPALMVHTAERLAGVRGVSLDEIAALTTANFHRLFPTTSNLEPRTSNLLYTSTMASDNSFDVVSKMDLAEVKNAVDQATKEINTRFDLKDSKSRITIEGADALQLASQDEYKLEAVKEILRQKLVKRGVSLKNLEYEKIEPAANSSVRQKIKLQQGIPTEKARQMVALVKEMKLKAQASIQGDTVRVTSKDRDTLQKIIAKLRAGDFGVALQFTNYRN